MNFNKFLTITKPYTMTSIDRIKSLFDSLEYIRLNNIDGDIVECGVWKGGNILGCIEYCKYYGVEKTFWLYDTFSGMSKSSMYDVDLNGSDGRHWEGKCDAMLNEVKMLINKTNYPTNKVKFIAGDICQTLMLEKNIPTNISLLRLDTDWYESTKKELEILYPKLSKNGVLIIDDYGHWKGCRKAVDGYFGDGFLFESIDYTGIKIIKTQ